MIKLLILLAVLAVSAGQLKLPRKLYCNDNGAKKFDQLVTDMFVFASTKRNFPTNASEMKKFCRESRKMDKITKEYSSECIAGVATTLTNVALFTFSREIRGICSNPNRAAEYYAAGHCGNQNRNGTTKCTNDIIEHMLSGINVTDEKLKFPIMCCNLIQWKACVVDAYRKVGPPACDEKSVGIFETQLDRVSVDPMRVVCGDYDEDNDKCEKLLASVEKVKRTGRRITSQLTAAIALIDSI